MKCVLIRRQKVPGHDGGQFEFFFHYYVVLIGLNASVSLKVSPVVFNAPERLTIRKEANWFIKSK